MCVHEVYKTIHFPASNGSVNHLDNKQVITLGRLGKDFEDRRT